MTQDLQKRTLFAGIALAIFLPILMIGGLLLQIELTWFEEIFEEYK